MKWWTLLLICGAMATEAVGELMTMLFGGAVLGGAVYSYCYFAECCDKRHIPFDVYGVRRDIAHTVFGQPMVDELFHILTAHGSSAVEHRKALAISFHGWPGNGKNFVANIIVKNLYKLGARSKYVKLYIGRYDFPDPTRVYEYRRKLKEELAQLVYWCPKALIIFDEVNDIPPQVLDVVKPMLDFHSQINNVRFSEAIFIFISNVGGNEIVNRLEQLDKPRHEIKLADFEGVIREAAYTHTGGFKEANIIDSHLIDHYIPFLPMEQNHVEMCVKEEFKMQQVTPSQHMIDEAMSVITYGPDHNPIYANAGCKRIKKQVAYVINRYGN